MSQCPLCGGEKVPGKTTYAVDLGEGIVNEIKKRACQVEVLSF